MADPFFDSNIVIDWLNDSQAAANELSRYNRHRISRIAWTEVLAGEPLATRATIQQILSAFEVVELDQRIATAAADIRHRVRMKLMDAYILATAQVNESVLVTRNTKDFSAQTPGVRVPYITP